MAIRKLRIACSGLGRMGARHALNFLGRTPRADLVAAFSPDDKELAWGRTHLEPYGVRLYKDYDEMLKHEGLEAVVIATITTVHAEEAIKAIKAGLHVLCEKPLSTNVEISQSVVDAARSRPDLKVLCGFSRRFDVSYRDAMERVENGDIGRPVIFRSQTCDKVNLTGSFIEYSRNSGGAFVDCNIHDIDLALWSFGQDSIMKSCMGVGITAVYPEIKEWDDVDNAVGVVEFWGGKVAYFYCSRTMAAGQHDMTEIIGTGGKLTVNANPQSSLVEMHESTGIRREIPAHYYGRFEHAFVAEANEFTAACLDNAKLPFKLTNAIQALAIACALQESVKTGKKIFFDETGRRVEKPSL